MQNTNDSCLATGIDQFRYTKIQPKTIDLTEFEGFIP